MRGQMMPLKKETAEKLFNRKASPEADMKPKEFMNMFMRGLRQSAMNYGKNVVGGAKIVGGAVKKGLTKVATKITAPTVRVMKARDAEMQEMDRKAKAGEFN